MVNSVDRLDSCQNLSKVMAAIADPGGPPTAIKQAGEAQVDLDQLTVFKLKRLLVHFPFFSIFFHFFHFPHWLWVSTNQQITGRKNCS